MKLHRVAPFLLLGPITGPLVAGVVFNFREGRPVLASLYTMLIVELLVVPPMLTSRLPVAESLQVIAAHYGISVN